jgi:hypothetical protein
MWLSPWPSRKSLLALAVLGVAAPLIFAAYRNFSLDWVDDAYATWGAGAMVVDFMRDQDDRWPRSWRISGPTSKRGAGELAAGFSGNTNFLPA